MAVHYVEAYTPEYEYELRPARHRVVEEQVKYYPQHHQQREYYVQAEAVYRSPAHHAGGHVAAPAQNHRLSLAPGAVNLMTPAPVPPANAGPGGAGAAGYCSHPRCRGALVRCWRHCCPKCGSDKSSVQLTCDNCGLHGAGGTGQDRAHGAHHHGGAGAGVVQVIKEQVQVPMVPAIPESALHRLSTLAQTHHSTLFRCLYDNAPAVEKVIIAETANYHDESTMHSLVDRHPNILRFYGLCRRSGSSSPSLILEQMQHDLQDRLHALQKDTGIPPQKLVARLIGYLAQVARALRHVHRNGVIHRDISARNMLMDGEVLKLSDFGLAKAVADKSPSNKPYPLNTAPEALRDLSNPNVWTQKCDVWQFGLLIWEVFSFGRDPLQRFNNSVDQLLAALDADWRPERPKTCPDAMWELLLHCIKQDPAPRPQFDEISNQLDLLAVRLRSAEDGF